jgi:hypothetical protein
MIKDHLPSSKNCCCSGMSSKLGSCGPSNCTPSIVTKYVQTNNTINKKQYTNNINRAKLHYKATIYVARVA